MSVCRAGVQHLTAILLGVEKFTCKVATGSRDVWRTMQAKRRASRKCLRLAVRWWPRVVFRAVISKRTNLQRSPELGDAPHHDGLDQRHRFRVTNAPANNCYYRAVTPWAIQRRNLFLRQSKQSFIVRSEHTNMKIEKPLKTALALLV